MAAPSRIEQILSATLGRETEIPDPPFSRIEGLLIDLKEAIEQGGGGGGDAQLAARVTALEGRATAIEAKDDVQDDLIDEKLDISDVPAMTKAEYDSLVTKTARYYFTYEDTTSSTANTNSLLSSTPVSYGLADPEGTVSHGLTDPEESDT